MYKSPAPAGQSPLIAKSDNALMTDENFRRSEARYRRLFESAQDGILLINAKTAEIEDANPFLIELLGYSFDELMGKKIWELGAFKDTVLNMEAFVELQKNHYIRYDDLPLVTKNGVNCHVEFVSNLYDCEGIEIIQCNIRDNTKRHVAEIALKAATRALKMLSESNNALLASRSESILLQEYCRIAVETGNYLMAWVGLGEHGPEKKVSVASCFGLVDGYLDIVDTDWADSPSGNGPAGRAIRTGEVQAIDDISADASVIPWRAEAMKRGYRSLIAIPFKLPDDSTACLTLYGSNCDVWSPPEIRLLREIASDLEFGISALRTAVAKVAYQINLRESLEQTIQVIADTTEQRDAYTAGHQRRVAQICSRIGAELGLSEDRVHGLHLAASIHDMGKIGIPSEILSKPRKLTDLEFRLIKEHAQFGFDTIKGVSFPWPIAEIILQHHERIDGSGYPRGLKGADLLLESKILAVADVVEAMASHRPYRAALGIEAALDEITAQRGITLDAEVVDACTRIFREQAFRIED